LAIRSRLSQLAWSTLTFLCNVSLNTNQSEHQWAVNQQASVQWLLVYRSTYYINITMTRLIYERIGI